MLEIAREGLSPEERLPLPRLPQDRRAHGIQLPLHFVVPEPQRPKTLVGKVPIPIGVAYKIDGKVTEDFPMTLDELARAEPIYETLPGWNEDITGVREFAALPDNARRYIERIETLVDVPVDLISVGPGRDETIARRPLFGPRG